MHIPLVRQLGPALVCLIAQFGLAGCTSLKPYWAGDPKPDGSFACEERAGGNLADPTAACATQASQRTANYALHYVEFDDEGIPFPETELQIDSAIAQIKRELSDAGNCVRLFVYVHGWRHNAAKSDRDVDQFGKFLEQMSGTPGSARSPGQTSCDAVAFLS